MITLAYIQRGGPMLSLSDCKVEMKVVVQGGSSSQEGILRGGKEIHRDTSHL